MLNAEDEAEPAWRGKPPKTQFSFADSRRRRSKLQVGHQQYKSKHHVKAWFCQLACSGFWWCVQQCKIDGSKEPQGKIWGEGGRVLRRGEVYGGEELHRWQREEICEHAAVWNNMKNVFSVCLPWIPAVVKLNWCKSKCGFRSEQNELYMMCWQMWMLGKRLWFLTCVTETSLVYISEKTNKLVYVFYNVFLYCMLMLQ